MPSIRANPNLRRQIYLALVGKVEGQLREIFSKRNEEFGLTQSDIARKLDVHRSVIQRRLKGETNMTLETVADMAWAVGACIDVDIFDPKERTDRNDYLRDATTTAWTGGGVTPSLSQSSKAESRIVSMGSFAG